MKETNPYPYPPTPHPDGYGYGVTAVFYRFISGHRGVLTAVYFVFHTVLTAPQGLESTRTLKQSLSWLHMVTFKLGGLVTETATVESSWEL